MLEGLKLSVVIPTRNSATYIARTINEVEALGENFQLSIVVVDDGSTDGTFKVLTGLSQDLKAVSIVLVEMARNVGQSAATAIGLSHADGDLVLTMDDDLTFPAEEVTNLLAVMTDELDFVVGAPRNRTGSMFRRAASQTVRWIGVRLFKTPSDFVFSSFVLYRRDFLSRIDIRSRLVDEVGWIFPLTTRYRNASVRTANGLRLKSNYGLRELAKTAAPLLSLLRRPAVGVLRALLIGSILTSVLLISVYLRSSLIDQNLQEGFPTLAILALTNFALSCQLFLSVQAIQRAVVCSQKTLAFNCQRRVVRIVM